MVDTVITNPPFGTKNNEGIDVQFLRTAIRLARSAVYSFHKTSTRQYLLKLLTSWGLNVEVVAEMKFDIQNMYKFHKEKVKDVEVDLIRVFWDDGVGGGDECESDSLDEEQE
jgi:predicted RNA methylase